jgi:pSer/pThr/pTyr-binding forkhead associated (FHA) protein
LDSEVKQVEGKGPVVPHNIKLKMQWDKFSTDADESLARLETELLAAAADHINDKLYYTYAPLTLKVTRDYFIEGVKLNVGFDNTDENDAELNVTMPLINIKEAIPAEERVEESSVSFVARHKIKGVAKQKTVNLPAGGRISIGRTGSSDLILEDISVSKIHASIAADDDGGLVVADTGSTNGTFINGKRIPYGKAMPLVNGDHVKFGEVEVEFELIASAAVVENIPKVPGIVETSPTPEKAAETAEKTLEIMPSTGDQAIPDTLLEISEDEGPVSLK